MTGYQEILSDPSYRGQGVLFTVPHLGNVGINEEDHESTRPQISAVVTRQLSPLVSNWRSTQPLQDWLYAHDIPGISEVDTRLLTRKLRDGGTQKAALSTCGTSPDKLLRMARDWLGLDGRDMVQEVSCAQPYPWQGDAGDRWIPSIEKPFLQKQVHLAAYDFGIKQNILRHLAGYNARITVIPASTPAKDVLAIKPDGIFLSNGPGDPAGLPYAVSSVESLIQSGIPIFGICLGHQLIGRALGAETRRLKFGHHGGNHPVQHLKNHQAFITAQNHNYCVDESTLDPQLAEITYRSLNDQSVEGLRMKKQPVFSVQYHPEAAPGPHDAHQLFNEFFNLIRGGEYA
jgi:carbamoyl-phosphate synthase small subunit